MGNNPLQNNLIPAINLAPNDNFRELPHPSWIKQAFIATVRLNENRHQARKILARLRPTPSSLMPFRASMLKPKICRPDKHARTLTDRILSIMFNSNFRKGPLTTIAERIPVFNSAVENAVRESRPIELVLPTLPCKNTNPLCTGQPARAVDLGEYAFFAQLRDIDLSVRNIFPPGLKITLICDGIVYADIFWNGDVDSAVEYGDACERVRDDMKLSGIVDLVDMSSLVLGEPRFNEIRSHVIRTLNSFEHADNALQEKLAMLRRGMLFNIPLNEFDFDDVAQLQSLSESAWPPEVFTQAHNAALSFASFLITAQHTAIISRAFPRAIRCTVHPKNAPQFPLHLVNRNSVVFPYNGVTVVSRAKWDLTGNLRAAIKTARLYDVLAQPNVTAVIRIGDSHPFFYMTE